MDENFTACDESKRHLGYGKRYRCCIVDYSRRTYLGFDLSTQKLKAVILDSQLNVLYSSAVHYDVDLPEFGTENGACRGDLPDEYHVNPVMWTKALDIVLNCLRQQGADMSSIAAISGAGQQHGSVYWSAKGFQRLCGLALPQRLHEQIDESAFTLLRTPIWMDGSTGEQCRQMELEIGGRAKMATTTGSMCYARFTGPQIRKIHQLQPEAYAKTVRISLVSSFLASLLIGNVAAIDYSDGSGMNLFNINKKQWSQRCMLACAPDLRQRLMQAVPTSALVGRIHAYYVARWGFRPDCMVAACTGDNPSALAGMSLAKNSIVISLGTSDTIIMHLTERPKINDVLCHPTDEDAFMGLLCFRNGSLVRQAICDEVAQGNWLTFNRMLETTPPGNHSNMAVHFPEMEIIPLAKGTFRCNILNRENAEHILTNVEQFERSEYEVRALIEGQMLHHRAVANDMGFEFNSETKIIVTGGASANQHLLQIMADVFNANVYKQTGTEAPLMGAAFRARYAFYVYRETACSCSSCNRPPTLSYEDFIARLLPNQMQLVCTPNPGSAQIYEPMLQHYYKIAQILTCATKTPNPS